MAMVPSWGFMGLGGDGGATSDDDGSGSGSDSAASTATGAFSDDGSGTEAEGDGHIHEGPDVFAQALWAPPAGNAAPQPGYQPHLFYDAATDVMDQPFIDSGQADDMWRPAEEKMQPPQVKGTVPDTLGAPLMIDAHALGGSWQGHPNPAVGGYSAAGWRPTAPAEPVPPLPPQLAAAAQWLPAAQPATCPAARPEGEIAALSRPAEEADHLVCPFCNASPDSYGGGCPSPPVEGGGGGKEMARHKRRTRRDRKQPRANFKLGQWWKGFGYNGPRYCQRCSEVFRDHLIRQQSNSAQCSRTDPCSDCLNVLRHFSDAEPWAKIDAREEQNRLKRKQRSLNAGLKSTKRNRVAAVATVTVATAVIALVTLHSGGQYAPFMAPSATCEPQAYAIEHALPGVCPRLSVGGECKFECQPGFEQRGAARCRSRVMDDAPAVWGGECVPCMAGNWSAGRSEACQACSACELAAVDSCTTTHDSVCAVPHGPFETSGITQRPPAVVDAATFTSPDGRMWMFGGQGPVGGHEGLAHFKDSDDEGFRNTLTSWKPKSGVGPVWERVEPRLHAPWPAARAGAMVWKRNRTSWFIFGGNRAGTTGMSDVWSFDVNSAQWTKHCPSPDDVMGDPTSYNMQDPTYLTRGTIVSDTGTLLTPSDGFFTPMMSTFYTTLLPGSAHRVDKGFLRRPVRMDRFKHVCTTENMGDWLPRLDVYPDIGSLDLRLYATGDALASGWPLPRAFGTITAVQGTADQAWLFGGAVGYDNDLDADEERALNVSGAAKVRESWVTNDLWHLRWDADGAVDWTFVGPSIEKLGENSNDGDSVGVQPGSYLGSRGMGDFTTYISQAEVPGAPWDGIWPSSRSGHAAWSASDGRLFIFGGVGLSWPGAAGEINMPENMMAADLACAMLGDLWVLDPVSGDNFLAVAGFVPYTGWEQSKWAMGAPAAPEGSPDRYGGISPDPYNPSRSSPGLSLGACSAYFDRNYPLTQFPEDQPLSTGGPEHWADFSNGSACPTYITTSDGDIPIIDVVPPQDPLSEDGGWLNLRASCWADEFVAQYTHWPWPRRAAASWSDGDTAWLLGGETILPDRPYLNDLWKIDMTAAPGTVVPRMVMGAMGAGRLSSADGRADGPGSPIADGGRLGVPMPGRGHAALWVHDSHSDADEPHSLPVLYGGTGRHGDWPWSNTHVVPAATNPSSTNPWISKYMDDIWAWSAPVSRSKLAVLG